MNAWLSQIFKSKIALRGGVVRRKLSTIERFSSKKDLKAECQKHGYHIVEHGDQWLIFCDQAHVKIII